MAMSVGASRGYSVPVSRPITATPPTPATPKSSSASASAGPAAAPPPSHHAHRGKAINTSA